MAKMITVYQTPAWDAKAVLQPVHMLMKAASDQRLHAYPAVAHPAAGPS